MALHRDELLQKKSNKIEECCNSAIISWSNNAMLWLRKRCPRPVTYGIREEFDFRTLCHPGRNGTIATPNRVGLLGNRAA